MHSASHPVPLWIRNPLPSRFAVLGVTLGASLLFPGTTSAGGPEYNPTPGVGNFSFATKYPNYYGSPGNFGCGSCHTSAPALNVYGAAYKTAVLALGGRTQANVGPALTNIQSADADGDGYTNISEINKLTNAADVNLHPTAAVALSTGQNAKSGTPTTAISYSVTVTNNGNLTDSFTLGVSVFSGQAWTPSIVGSANNIAAGGTANITVNLTISGAATAGQTSVARVTAVSKANATISATALNLTTTATAPSNATRYVNAATGNNAGTCTNSGSPCKTITYAMNQAAPGSPGDLVSVAPGTYNLALGEVFPIVVKSGVQLKATGSASNTTIDAVGDTIKNGVLRSQGNTSTSTLIEGFTIKNGVVQAGLNGVALGGGIYVASGTGLVTITRNVISGNEARGYSSDGSSGMTGNIAWGGGLYVFASNLNVTNNVFTGNIARGGNGFSHPGTPLTGNENGGQGVGGAIYFFGSGNITNNTFYGNSAIGGSGGITSTGTGASGDASSGGVSTGVNVDNNIFVNNSATAGTGGFATTGALSKSNAGTVANNLFFGNTQNGAPSADTVGVGYLTVNPLFVSAPANLRITNSSPAKGAGVAGVNVPITDLDGQTRPSPPSIGAFEAAPPCTPGGAFDSDSDGIPDTVESGEGRNACLKDNDVFTSARLFSMQQYRDFLGREGDAGGISFWVGSISGGMSRAAVTKSFFDSPEFQGAIAPVTRLYFAYFNRIPDKPGLDYWIAQYGAGTSLNTISQAFASSPEFIGTYGSLNNSDFVTLVYQNVLGRAPDGAGLAYWVGQLNGGFMTRGQVMVGFSESPEYQQSSYNRVFVTMIYYGMLRRVPEQFGFNYWVATLNAGASALDLINAFLAAPEYRARFLP